MAFAMSPRIFGMSAFVEASKSLRLGGLDSLNDDYWDHPDIHLMDLQI